MFGIPFLGRYIQQIVKEQTVADSADWLNYYCTSIMLAFFSLAISAKQYFGSVIKCWTPNEFKGGWDRYAENYCFIANSYFVPFDEEVPSDLKLRADQISYYRWVPIMLAMQALLFWIPNWLWNMLHKQTAVNPRAMVSEASRSRCAIGEEREKEIENFASFIADVLSAFHYRKGQQGMRLSGYNATALYLAIKLLYVLNCVGQLILLNQFLGGQYFIWGYQQFASVVRGEEWKESEIFPRVIMCDFEVRRLADPQRHTIQCVLMMNMINEKLYFFLYFWLLFVGVTTIINFFYYFAVMTIPFLRTKFVLYNISRKEQKMRGMRTRDLNRFVHRFLRPDGVLLLQFIRQHVGGRVTYDLMNELLRIYWMKECRSHEDDNTTTTKSSPISDQTPRGNDGNYERNITQQQRHNLQPGSGKKNYDENTYKPTQYGPSSLYPNNYDRHTYNSDTNYDDDGNEWAEKRPLSPGDFIDSESPTDDAQPTYDYGFVNKSFPPPTSSSTVSTNNGTEQFDAPAHSPPPPPSTARADEPSQQITPQLTPLRNGFANVGNGSATVNSLHSPFQNKSFQNTPSAHSQISAQQQPNSLHKNEPKMKSSYQSSV